MSSQEVTTPHSQDEAGSREPHELSSQELTLQALHEISSSHVDTILYEATAQHSQDGTNPPDVTLAFSSENHYDSDTISIGSAAPDIVDNIDQYSKQSDIADSSSESIVSVNNERALKAKEHLSSIGLTDEFYNVNLSTYYLLVSQDDDLDFINFADIVNNSCSVSLDNLSSENIKFEQELLKSSSPVRSGDITSSTHSTHSDNEKTDPTYGSAKKGKPSLCPRRKPSSKRIAAQRLINKTRQKFGSRKDETKYYLCKPSQSYELKLASCKTTTSKKPVVTKTSTSKTIQTQKKR